MKSRKYTMYAWYKQILAYTTEFIQELLEEETLWLSDDFQMKLKLHKSWYIAF